MISIILPIYNMQNYIAECLESVVNQTYKDIEIICVNDFCMDNSMTIVKEFAKNDSRIKIINNEKNRGLGGARNAGLEVAIGEYVIFVDTDDKIMPDMAEKLYNCITENDADMVFCDLYLFGKDKKLKAHKPFHDPVYKDRFDFYPKQKFWEFTDIWPSAWNKIYKKSIIDKNNLRYKENILYEDHTFYYEYLFASNKVIYLPKPLYIYRNERDDSIMKTASPRVFEIFTILNYIKEIFKKNLDNYWYNILMPKISVRLIWERAWNLSGNIEREFIKKSQKYLSQFKKKNIFKYKDWFIGSELEFLYSPFEIFLKKTFSIRNNKYSYDLYLFGQNLTFYKTNGQINQKLDMLDDKLNYICGVLENANK